MIHDPLTLYKLIVLYILNRVTFPLTKSQISDFILEKEYTNFLTVQQALSELTDAKFIAARSIRNRTHLTLTDEGRETLAFFENRISDAIKADVDTYFREHEFTLRNEVAALADYYKSTSGEYETHLIIRERDINLIDLTMSVPVEEVAVAICDNWQKKNQEIYKFLVEKLF